MRAFADRLVFLTFAAFPDAQQPVDVESVAVLAGQGKRPVDYFLVLVVLDVRTEDLSLGVGQVVPSERVRGDDLPVKVAS